MVKLAYLLSAIMFILGLKQMARPRTAVRGNLLGAAAMLLAVLVTFRDVLARPDVDAVMISARETMYHQRSESVSCVRMPVTSTDTRTSGDAGYGAIKRKERGSPVASATRANVPTKSPASLPPAGVHIVRPRLAA